jgi:adenylyltransferase/sulfurtransferase
MNLSDLPDPSTSMEVQPCQVESLADCIKRGECLLIDCREDDEWRINRLPEAKLAPLSSFATEAARLLPKNDIPCIIYCHHGMRSLRAVEWLRSHGHERSWSMQGGIHAWSEIIDPKVPKY